MPAAPVERVVGPQVEVGGRRLVRFGGCDYHALSRHPDVLAAAHAALDRYGVSVSASRETTGETAEHAALEDEVAAFLAPAHPGSAAVLVPDGYLANITAAQMLSASCADATGQVGTCGAAVLDERTHASVVAAMQAANLPVTTYAHGDPDAARDAVRAARRRGAGVVLATDGVFAATGAVAPVRALLDTLDDRDVLLIDDCHGFTVLGGDTDALAGRGTAAAFSLRDPRVVVASTLGKGLGCGGGFVLGPAAWVAARRLAASAYVGTTPVSPASAAAARCALQILAREPGRVRTLADLSARLHAAVSPVAPGTRDRRGPTPIATFSMGDAAHDERLFAALSERGLLVPLISYPGGPAGPGGRYFRASVCVEHTAEQMARLAAALQDAARARTGPDVAVPDVSIAEVGVPARAIGTRAAG